MSSRNLLGPIVVLSVATLALVGCGAQPGSSEDGEAVRAVEVAPTAPAAGATSTIDENGFHSRVLRDATTPIVVKLDEKTVFCTDRGYGNIVLKASVADLDWLAFFDHRVEGEGLPCVTAGACSDTLQPVNIIDPADPLESTTVRVVLTEKVSLDQAKHTCSRWLEEDVTTTIRGTKFSHQRSGTIEPSDWATCVELTRL